MPPKESEIKIRVTDEMKKSVGRVVAQRGEAEAVIVREAINYYLSHAPAAQLAETPPPYRVSDRARKQ
jgi:predicted DNA-binding protein